MNKIIFAIVLALGLAVAAVPATAFDPLDDGVVCQKDEQRGCLTFQIAGAKYSSNLAPLVERARGNRRVEVTTLGMDVLEGMVDGTYRQAGKKSYCLILWMKPQFFDEIGGRDFPFHRMGEFRVANAANPGKVTSHKVASDHGCRGKLPVINDPRVPSLGQADFSFSGSQSGAGLGWGVPYDVAKYIAYAMICPDGETYYPDRINANMGIVFTGDEIRAALGRGWEYIVAAVVWQ